MSDVASLSVALHLNSAAFKSQITDAYQSAGQASKKFNKQATDQANELSAAIAKTVDAAKKIGVSDAGTEQFAGATRGAGQLNYVLHEVAAGSNVASSSIINALIPAVHTLKGQLDSSSGSWQTQRDAARNAAAELAQAAQNQIHAAQAEKQAAQGKITIAEKTVAAAKAQREHAIALDEYYEKQAQVNKQFGLNVSYQEEHLKNERAIIEANRLETSALDKLKTAKAAVTAAELAETGGKAALTASTEAAAAANTQLSISQRVAATSSRALSSALGLLGGPVGIGLTVLAAGGTLLYSEFKKGEEQTKKLNSALLDLKTSSLVTAQDLKRLSGEMGNTEASIDAVITAAKAGFSGKLLTDVATLANAYSQAGGSAQDLVSHLSALRGDPIAAMQKVTASGVILSESIISQIVALNQRGDAARASNLLIDEAIRAEKARLAELGIEVDKTAETVKHLGNVWGTAGEQAVIALGGAIDKSQVVNKQLGNMAKQLAADINAASAAAQNERIKNSADLKNYMDTGTSAAEKRAEAIKKLNNSIYKPDSQEYTRVLKGINDEYDRATKKTQPKSSAGALQSEGQKLLEQVQQRHAVLQEEANTTVGLTQSAQQLVAFNQKISGFKDQQLTQGQQSLVAMQDQIRAQLQSNVQLEKAAELRKVSLKYQQESKKWDEEVAALRREASQNLESYSRSDRESAEAEAKLAVENRFNQRRLALENDFTDKSSSEYLIRIADLESAKQRELQIVEQSLQDRQAAENDYSAGFRRGTKNWIDSAKDANSQIANFSSGLFDSMTGSLATFATTGKLNFRDFTTSILSDLAKISTRIALSSALESIFGAASSAFTGGSAAGSTPSGAYNSAAANVKFNAKGGVYDSPSLSSFSNQVYDSPQMFAFAKGAGVFGEAGPEAIMPLTRGADGSLGVRAVGSGSAQVAAPVVYITIESNGNSNAQSASGFEQFGKEIGNFVDQRYRRLVTADLRPSGAIWNTINGRR